MGSSNATKSAPGIFASRALYTTTKNLISSPAARRIGRWKPVSKVSIRKKSRAGSKVRGSIADYCNAAAKHLVLGGFFACVFQIEPAPQLARVHEAAKAVGLSIVRQRPVVFRER